MNHISFSDHIKMEKGGADAYMANAAGNAAHEAASNAATNASRGIFFDRAMIRSKEMLLKIAELVSIGRCIGFRYFFCF